MSSNSEHTDGATPSQLIIEAARRNNTELLDEVLSETKNPSDLINNSRDAVGRTSLHVAAATGSYDALDIILDKEGVEVDPIEPMEGNTPLHLAARYSQSEPDYGAFIVETLIDAGADPRIQNKLKQKPIDLADRSNKKVQEILKGAEMARMFGGVDQSNAEENEDQGEGEGYGTDSDSDK